MLGCKEEEMAAKSDIEKVMKSLKANRFNQVVHCATSAEAVKIILDMIPADASLEMAGSMSVSQTGLLDLLKKRGNKGLDMPKSREEFSERQKTRQDVLLVSTNAITLDGKLVNTDGFGNRVAGMIFGVKKVILLIGKNKIVRDLDEAFDRVQHVIAPYHAKYLGLDTPCAKKGKCCDCNSPQRICNITTVISKKPLAVDFTIILVDEDLGLGWDPAWPEKRKEKIASAYREEIGKFTAAMPKIRLNEDRP
jgi:hypothetical protein